METNEAVPVNEVLSVWWGKFQPYLGLMSFQVADAMMKSIFIREDLSL